MIVSLLEIRNTFPTLLQFVVCVASSTSGKRDVGILGQCHAKAQPSDNRSKNDLMYRFCVIVGRSADQSCCLRSQS